MKEIVARVTTSTPDDSRRYTAEIMPIIGPNHDIPAPDMGTNAQTMAWIMDTISMHQGHTVNAVITGKPFFFAAGADITEFPDITRDRAVEGAVAAPPTRRDGAGRSCRQGRLVQDGIEPIAP